jgi:hypothetical protein
VFCSIYLKISCSCRNFSLSPNGMNIFFKFHSLHEFFKGICHPSSRISNGPPSSRRYWY